MPEPDTYVTPLVTLSKPPVRQNAVHAQDGVGDRHRAVVGNGQRIEDVQRRGETGIVDEQSIETDVVRRRRYGQIADGRRPREKACRRGIDGDRPAVRGTTD